jgi:hypothetical protein
VLYKWDQPPDLTMWGMDVNATRHTNPPPPQPYLLADDFPCTSTGPLTDITIWGSWTNDLIPSHQFVSFTLSIHRDIPANSLPPFFTNHSMPGPVLWTNTFGPGQYQWRTNSVGEEGWLNPPTNFTPIGDWTCLQYDFHVSTNAFIQTNGFIYWLDVQARVATPVPIPRFGWKTTPYMFNWNDDAVWVHAVEPYSGGGWKDLHYPVGHPYGGASINLAFALANSQSTYQLKWSQPPLPGNYVTIKWNSENGIHYQMQATPTLNHPPVRTKRHKHPFTREVLPHGCP